MNVRTDETLTGIDKKMATINRRAYAEMFGPTTGDRVRLADTGLIVEVEKDFTLSAGGYVVWRVAPA